MAKDFNEDDKTGEGSATANAGKSNKGLVVALVALVVLAGGGAGLYFSGALDSVLKKGPNDAEKAETQAAQTEPGKDGGAPGKPGTASQPGKAGPIYFSFPDNYKFIANLNTGGKQTSFLKVDVSLELAGPNDLQAVNSNLPRIMDIFNTYLRELRPSDLQGSAGVYRLREELLLRVNKAIYPAKVNDVLFKEIIVQ